MRNGRNRWAVWVIAPALLVGLAFGNGTAMAQDAATPAGCEVVADGLMNPRQLAIATNGTLYVTEAGTGGDEVLDLAGPEEEIDPAASPAADAEASPAAEAAPEEPPVTRGTTGQVTAVSPDGTQSVVADGLPSYSIGVGPVGIVLGDGMMYVSIGGLYAPELEPLPNQNAVVAIDLASGEVTNIADLGPFEIENNPDGTDINPNLYGMDIGADGALYVADAGGNTIYRVDPALSEVALLGVVPSPAFPADLAAPAPADSGTPSAEEPEALHPVPTGIDVGADGNVYVGLLGAFVPGAGSVLIAQADGTFVEAATGLTTVIGVA
ncbi:MAG: ScyD/ScyE family protein, partial [Chloroflexota bacterium]|nr:ScyD/ScyE family protein [Chloroflexota bacterium]